MDRRNFKVSACAECLSVVSFGLAVVTVVSPHWGRFSSDDAVNSGDLITGYFGLWTVCKDLSSQRSFCGLNVTAFHLTTWTFIAGLMAAVGVAAVGVASVVGICLLLMLKSRERVCIPYRPSVILRLVLSVLSALMATIAIAMASIRTAERLPYSLYRGWAFYVHMVLIAAEVALTLAAAYDFILSRRLGGDPTFYSRDPTGSNALTYSNPSFAGEDNGTAHIKSSSNGHSNGAASTSGGHHLPHKSPTGRTSPHRSSRSGSGRLGNGSSRSNGSIRSGSRTASRSGSRTGSRSNGISGGGGGGGGGKQRSSGIAMTSSSAHPYSMSPNPSSVDSIDHHQSTSSILNSSFGSIETTSSIMSSSSISSNPNALSPRKSSLKKPNSSRHSVPTSPLPGDPNGLGFANVGFAEPRTGSMKRVRIASQSTDV